MHIPDVPGVRMVTVAAEDTVPGPVERTRSAPEVHSLPDPSAHTATGPEGRTVTAPEGHSFPGPSARTVTAPEVHTVWDFLPVRDAVPNVQTDFVYSSLPSCVPANPDACSDLRKTGGRYGPLPFLLFHMRMIFTAS